MANQIQSNISANFQNIRALMSPAFDKVANAHISQQGNSNLSLSEALNEERAQSKPKQKRRAEGNAESVEQPRQRMVEQSRDFSYLDGSNMTFQQEAPKGETEITDDMIRNSQLPSFLKESFLAVKPQSINEAESEVDLFAQQLRKSMGIPDNQQQITEDKKPYSSDDEEDSERYYDYQSADIRKMVEEIVKKELAAMYKSLKKDLVSVANQIIENVADDSKLSSIHLGDSLRFVDSEGNVFEAKLEYKGTKKKKQ